jgi:hypothetical protein
MCAQERPDLSTLSLSDFEYEPLDYITDSTRVLEVLPGADDDVVRYTMIPVTISGTQYTCLSYTWLPEYPKHDIEVNEKCFWVDTYCIDRWNLRELSSSINSMFHWYKNAAGCYVLLGTQFERIVWSLSLKHLLKPGKAYVVVISARGR